MRILLTGASGLLGSHLLRTADPADEFFTDRFDIQDRDSARFAMDQCRPEMILHCAAEGRVDFAELHPDGAWSVNASGTQNLLMEAKRHKAHFVHISTNAVYDGAHPPYHEYSIQKPVNRYGWTKKDAEDMVDDYEFKSTIIRPIMLYGWPKGRGNFVNRTLTDLGQGKPVRAAEDIITQPTYAKDCAKAIWKIAKMQQKQTDEVNLAPWQQMSLYRFACEIALTWELDADLVIPVKSAEFKGLAPRPLDTTYNLSKLDRMGITLMGAGRGLAEMKREIP